MPLVRAEAGALEEPRNAAHARARKVHPPYAEGEPVRVATAHNQPEAELLQGLLLEEGIPSLVRRSGGFDVPDFLAAGPRDVLVPEAGWETARELLHETELAPSAGAAARPNPLKLFAAILIGGGAVALLAWVLQGPG